MDWNQLVALVATTNLLLPVLLLWACPAILVPVMRILGVVTGELELRRQGLGLPEWVILGEDGERSLDGLRLYAILLVLLTPLIAPMMIVLDG